MSPRIARAHSAHNPRPEAANAPAHPEPARVGKEHAEACEHRFARNIIEAYQQWVADGRPDRR